MDAFGGFMPKRDWFEPVEILNLDRSMETFKAEEARVIENDAGHQAFLFGFYQVVQVAIAIASGDDDPFFDSNKFSGENVVTVEEFRAALRSAVIDGAITSKEAGSFTWDTAQKMLEAKGQSLVGLSQEIRAAEVYVSEPVRYSSPTREDWEGIINAIRAGQDRKRETTRKRSWETLKNHLEKICQQALDDAEILHQNCELNTPRSDTDLQGIARLLASMPRRFRRQAFCHSIFGVRHFMRNAILVQHGPDSTFSADDLNIRVPLTVPMAEPAGVLTVLTWFQPDNEQWTHQMPNSPEEFETPETILDLNLESLSKLADSGDSSAKHLLSIVERNGPLVVADAWKSSELTSVHLAVIGDNKKSKRDPWYEIIRKARVIFGWETDVETLRQFMGLYFVGKTNLLKCDWKFTTGDPLDSARFKIIFREINGQQGLNPDVSPAPPESLTRLMSMIAKKSS